MRMTGNHHTGQNPEISNQEGPTDLLVDQAIAWLARDGVDVPGTKTHDAFQVWCDQSPAHDRAARQVRAFLADSSFDDVLRKFDTASLNDGKAGARTMSAGMPSPSSHARPLRRDTGRMGSRMRSVFAGAAAVCAAVLVAVVTLSPADHSTHPGYIAANTASVTQALPDGSTLQLARGTELYWEFSKRERLITLDKGAVVISAAPNRDRPLVVTTPQSRVSVVGTRFVVIGDDNTSEVGVAEGTVRVTQQQSPPAREVTLHAGDGVVVSGDGDVRLRDFDGASIEQVLVGWRVFSGASLIDVIHAVNRQSGTEILLDPRLSDLEIRGRFNVADATASLDLLTRTIRAKVINLPFGYRLLTR
ncbi:hypothetical protein TALK_05040 [Thalassospira alkalitolerans]|uniref:FecR protein domain-containing protein n=2 Tax=Thalassospira alkalitolerans TaxID=1293890 RepID=A0A1Y2LH73_9PROT|nr:hypothetical protein TALK_05040 [Thalassospira alkalitolerans]